VHQPTTPLLIGLIGRKRTGKDTLAATLVDELGFARVAFADPLRELALAIDPLVGPAPLPGDGVPRYRRLSEVVAAIGWEAAKDCVPEVRSTALQSLGQALRGVDEGFWVEQAMETVDHLRCPVRPYPSAIRAALLEAGFPLEEPRAALPVVVTDVRMPNEAEAIRAVGGVLVRVTRPGTASADEHVTETALDDYPEDFLIENDRDLEALRAEAHALVRTIR
jgi:hypothetical protein